jgi:hypothetical protein
MSFKGPIPTEGFSRDYDSSKVQEVTNSNFYGLSVIRPCRAGARPERCERFLIR